MNACRLWNGLADLSPEWPETRRFALFATLTFPPFRRKALETVGRYCRKEDRVYAFEAALLHVEKRMATLAGQWKAHPHFQERAFRKPWDAEVLAVYTHRPGRDGKETSFLQAPFSECISEAQYTWCTERMGTFLRFESVPPTMAVDPRRIGFVNNSAKTAASRGYFVRSKLKKLLPPEARAWVNKARSANRTRKVDLLKQLVGEWNVVRLKKGVYDHSRMRNAMTLEERPTPRWYREQTKREIWLRRVLPKDVQATISELMPLKEFWRASVGEVHPQDVEDLFFDVTRKELRALERTGQPTFFMASRRGAG